MLNFLELDFLTQSNWIESEYSKEALEDAMTAWEYFKNDSSPMFSFETIQHAHYLLLRRSNLRIAGELRDCTVYIGNCKKLFISKVLLEEEVRNLCRDIILTEHRAGMSEKGDNQVTKNLHIQFEDIHPFEYGNGRVGRIIYNAHRLRLGLPIHVIYENDKYAYYRWFTK